MSDALKRDLERLSADGDRLATVRLLRGRLRDGTLLASRLALAAYCGDAAAFEALEPDDRDALLAHEWRVFEFPGDEDALELWSVFERAGVEAEKRAAQAAVVRARESFANDSLPTAIPGGVPPAHLEARIASDLLEQAFRGERAFASAFIAAARAVGVRACFQAVSDALLPWAEEHDRALAALLGSKAARREIRPALPPARWTRGLGRWGAVPLIRAGVVATRLVHPDDPALASVEKWLERPTNLPAAAGWRDSALGNLVNESTGSCGLPVAIADWHAAGLVEQIAASKAPGFVRDAIREELRAFALASSGPLFRFGSVAVLEELGYQRLGWTFRGRDEASGAAVDLVAIDRWLPFAGVRKALEPYRVLDHPNLVRLVAIHGSEDGHERGAVVVFERAAGRVLGPWAFALSAEEKRDLIVQLCRGIEHAHEKRVVHGGLEPECIRVEDGVARAGGFGALDVENLEVDADPERDPAVRKHGFWPPEVIDPGLGRPGPATDQYALAAITSWLFREEEPFAGEDIYSLLRAILDRPAPPSPVHGAAIARAMAKKPAERFESLAAFRRALLDG